jgi:hypothetical protein
MPIRVLRPRFRITNLFLSTGIVLSFLATYAFVLSGYCTRFDDAHPRQEIVIAQELLRQEARPLTILTSYWAMKDHVSCKCPTVFVGGTAAMLLRDTNGYLLSNEADYLIVGRRTSFGSAFGEMVRQEAPKHLSRVRADSDALVYRVVTQDIASTVSVPFSATLAGDDEYSFTVALDSRAPKETRMFASLHGPHGETRLVELAPSNAAARHGTASLRGLPEGDWSAVPKAILPDGTLLCGASVPLRRSKD